MHSYVLGDHILGVYYVVIPLCTPYSMVLVVLGNTTY